jgi:hypothetical protein
MSKHTPGPWQVHGSHIYTADPERALLAQVFNSGSKASDYPLQANARLIAAAPELLEALKECLPYVGQTLANTGSMDAYYTEAKACAAIAKATGEQT